MKSTLTILWLILASSVLGQTTYFNLSYNPNNTFSIGLSIDECNDSYYVSGSTSDSIQGNRAIFISRIDNEGNLIFWKTYQESGKQYWSGYTNSLVCTNLGHLILAGAKTQSYQNNQLGAYYNFDLEGDTNLIKYYRDTTYLDQIILNQCKRTSDAGIIFVGNITKDEYNSDVLLLKTNYSGQEEWRSNFGRPPNYSIDQGFNIIETSDGGFIVGSHYYFATNLSTGDPYIYKFDNAGNFLWEVNLGGPYEDLITTVCESNDGNYMCATSISDSTFGNKLLTRLNISKVSTSGDVLWSKTIGDRHLWNKVHGIYPDHNNGFVLCGYRHDDVNGMNFMNSCGWICKIDENGDSIWWREYEHFDDPEWHLNNLFDLHLASDGGYIAIGETRTTYEPEQMWLLKLDSMGCDSPGCDQVGMREPACFKLQEGFELYPNPANAFINLKFNNIDEERNLLIYNSQGVLVKKHFIPRGIDNATINISSFNKGLYIINMISEPGICLAIKFIKK